MQEHPTLPYQLSCGKVKRKENLFFYPIQISLLPLFYEQYSLDYLLRVTYLKDLFFFFFSLLHPTRRIKVNIVNKIFFILKSHYSLYNLQMLMLYSYNIRLYHYIFFRDLELSIDFLLLTPILYHERLHSCYPQAQISFL